MGSRVESSMKTLPIIATVYGQLGDKPTGRQSTGRQTNRATTNWATHFGQLGDNAHPLPELNLMHFVFFICPIAIA